MQSAQHLRHAIEVASEAHQGQLDKVGKPYIEHCRRVAELMTSDEECIVAYLHDIPEKAPAWTLDRLKAEGFSASILAAVDALTRRPSETDEELVLRGMRHPIARSIKRADLEDNLLQAEEAGLSTDRYMRGLETFKRVEAGEGL